MFLYNSGLRTSHITGMLGGHATTPLASLLEQLEGSLLGYVAHCAQLLDGLLASGLLATADDTTTLGLDQVLLVETTGSVLSGAVEDLGLGADSLDLAAHHSSVVLASAICATGSTTS